MLLKGMAESSLLPKDQPLTPNIDRVMGFELLEGCSKYKKWRKLDFTIGVFMFSLGRTMEASALEKKGPVEKY